MIFYFKILNLGVRENEISLPKWSGGTAQLRTWEGTLFTAAFSVSFIVTVFVPDIEIVQKKVICL